MIQVNRDLTLTDFFHNAALFLAQPEFGVGVQLVDLTARLESCCRAELAQHPALAGHFFRFKRAVPSQDLAQLQQELVQIQLLLQDDARQGAA